MTTLYAQPYDSTAKGFSFDTTEAFEATTAQAVNTYGQRVEEFEIQFIDGEAIDCALFGAWRPGQGDIGAFLDAVDDWDDDRKLCFIIAVDEIGYAAAAIAEDPDAAGIDIYPVESMCKLAMQFVDEGLFGPIPEPLQFYLDYEAIAHDLAVDYAETDIAGVRCVYRSA